MNILEVVRQFLRAGGKGIRLQAQVQQDMEKFILHPNKVATKNYNENHVSTIKIFLSLLFWHHAFLEVKWRSETAGP